MPASLDAEVEQLKIALRALQLEAHRNRVWTMAIELLLVSSTTDRAGMARVVRELAERRMATALASGQRDEELDAGASELEAFADRLERIAQADRDRPQR